MKRKTLTNLSRALALFSCALGGGIIAVNAWAQTPHLDPDNPNAPVIIADEPLGSLGVTPINLMLLADDSGSMLWTFAPEDMGDVPRACWYPANNGGMFCSPASASCRVTNVCGYPYPNPDPKAATEKERELHAVKIFHPQFFAYAFNKMAYNPLFTYTPPIVMDVDGVKKNLPSMKDASNNWTKVGWPETAGFANTSSRITRPQGAPVFLDFTKFTDANKYKQDEDFMAARAYTAARLESLRKRYITDSAGAEQLAEADKLGDPARDFVAPLHYFKTRVKWCRYYQSIDASSDGNKKTPETYIEGSLFMGSASAEDCRNDRTELYRYPYFYNPSGTFDEARHGKKAPFEVVVLDYTVTDAAKLASLMVHKITDEQGNDVVVTRSYEQELENYANWYAYYSNKTVAMRTVASFALSGIDLKHPLQVGFSVLNNSSAATTSLLTDMNNKANRFQVYKTLLEHGVTGNKDTPLKAGVDNIRNAFYRDAGKTLKTCSRNYTVAISDGLWNDTSSSVGNLDDRVTVEHKGTKILGVELIADKPFPAPIRENPSASANGTLADTAMKGWITPLNSGKPDTTMQDPAEWTHVNLIGLSYATEIFTMPAKDQAALDALSFGELTWEKQNAILNQIANGKVNWSAPEKNKSSAAEDFWHATLTGFGSFTASSNPQSFFTSIEEGSNAYQLGLRYILNRHGAGSESALPPGHGCEAKYHAGYLKGWAGDVIKGELNCNLLGVLQTPKVIWDASKAFNDRYELNKEGWWKSGNRNISTVKVDGSTQTQVDFQYENLSAAQRNVLGADAAEQKAIIDYLRGNNQYEINNEFNPFAPQDANKPIHAFRSRYGELYAVNDGGAIKYGHRPLGDIVHAEPVMMDPPAFVFDEKIDKGYAAFKEQYKERPRVVFVASNDGMLHAFDDNGKELWAFIPPELLRSTRGIEHLARLSPNADETWKHYYYVDAPPRVIDVDMNAGTGSSPDWHTVLVGGMGKGGTSYYALDVTQGHQQRGSFMWTFTDTDMGYTYGRALIVKTKNAGWGGKWVAIVPSGLNNVATNDLSAGGSGKGVLYFVDIASGKRIHKIELPSLPQQGNTTQPTGLTYIRGYINAGDESSDQTVLNVYGGDQFGNVWRFDLTDTNKDNWSVERIATLTDNSRKGDNNNMSHAPQPINTEPAMEIVKLSGGGTERWIIVGTGRFYDEKDVYNKVDNRYPALRHGMYVFKDGSRANSDPTLKTSSPLTQEDFYNATNLETLPSTLDGKKGWVDYFDDYDLAEGFQVITNPVSVMGIVLYTANRYILPGTEHHDICKSAQFESISIARDLKNNGKRVVNEKGHDGLVTPIVGVTTDGKLRFILATDSPTGGSTVVDPAVTLSGGGEGVNPHRSTIRFLDAKSY
ncbi:MAG: hypothetical protein LBG61_00865 [Burkholderiales bacterium]|nr:hypothetical protein [Burkholderiales bacterium]